MIDNIRARRFAVCKKLSTAERVYRSDGMRGLTLELCKKIGAWWRQGDPWDPKKWRGVPSTTVRLDGCSFITDNKVISPDVKTLLLNGQYEMPERIAVKRFLNPDLPVVELGGCIGVVSCVTNKRLLNPDKHIVLEANPNLIPLLEENRDRNGCSFRVLNRSVAYREEKVSFYLNPSVLASSIHIPGTHSVPVRTVTLRNLVDQFDLERFSLICDIEGGEIELVENESEVISKRIALLIIEIHDRLMGSAATGSLLRRLEEIGFGILYRNWDTYVFRNNRIIVR